MSSNLAKFGVPLVGRAASGVRHRTGGTCGIEPLQMAKPPPPPPAVKLPDHLIRPPCVPCMAGQEQNLEMRSCFASAALYCPPQKEKYKYPPFSDNIDFVPSGDVECWWAKVTPSCGGTPGDEDERDESTSGF